MKTTSIILLVLGLSATAFRTENTGTIVVSVSNVKKSGKIYVALYNKGDKFPDAKARLAATAQMCDGPCTLRFEAIPYGTYAIAVYQDLNQNNELDKGMFGIPSEPFAFSNNFKPRFGAPKFEDCQFSVSAPQQEVSVTLIHSLFGE